MLKKIKNKIILKERQKGFVILIAVMVSMILLSIGMFIASVAVREIKLSSSAKDSQTAFFAADAVLECALLKEFKLGGFSTTAYTSQTSSSAPGGGSSLNCNNKDFAWDYSQNQVVDGKDVAVHVYYISFAENIAEDSPANGIYTKNEIEDSDISPTDTRKEPYVKLIVHKAVDYSNSSKIQVYGHNIREGDGVIERAIEVVW